LKDIISTYYFQPKILWLKVVVCAELSGCEAVLQDVSKYHIVIYRILCNSKNEGFVQFSYFRKTTDTCFDKYLMVQTSKS